ncbi:MAG: SLBB domain-containing protein [Armatimonadota bacterium]
MYRIATVAVFILLCCTLGLAQVTPAYRLGPDDRISVFVQDHPELSGDFLLPADGVIDLPVAGRLEASGKTLSELTEAVTVRLKTSLRTPRVHVNLKEARLQRVFVLGDVARPGAYDLKPDWRITEALAVAGGQLTTPADCRAILLRENERTVRDLPAVLRNDAGANPVLRTGDVLTIERIELFPVYVTGAVKSPGMYQLRAGGGAVEALALAGGLSAQVTDVSAAIMRGTEQAATVDLDAALVKHDAKANIPLQRGDLLIVKPQEWVSVYVMGAVGKPGLLDIRAGSGVVEAIARAGGFTLPEHDLRISVVRGSHAVAEADTAQAMKVNVPLQPGDVVKVDSIRVLPVTVSGQVKTPGSYELKTGDRLLDALAVAGGTLENAATSRLSIVHRDGTLATVDLARSLQQGDMAQNLPLVAGDLIIVPESIDRVAVLGYVNKPGFYPVPDGRALRLTDALGLAGGTENQRGGIKQVAILRMVNGQQQRVICDLEKFFKSADPACNPSLLADDIVYVPETRKPNWDVIFRALSAVGLVYGQVLN